MPTALVVDSDPQSLEELCGLLTQNSDHRFSWSALKAESCRAALSALDENEVDIIFIRAGLPGIKAKEIIREISSYHEAKGLPIIAFSENRDHEVESLSAGAVDFITWPVTDIPSLLARARNLAIIGRQRNEARKAALFVSRLRSSLKDILLDKSDILRQLSVYPLLESLRRDSADKHITEKSLEIFKTADEVVAFINALLKNIFRLAADEDRRKDILDKQAQKYTAQVNAEIIKSLRAVAELERVRDEFELDLAERKAELAKVNEMISMEMADRHRAEQAQRESEELMAKITSAVNEAIITTGSDGKVSYWNPAAERIFGYAAGETIGKPLRELIFAKDETDSERKLSGLLKDDLEPLIGKTLELIGRKKNGENIFIELSFSQIESEGSWRGIITVRDITLKKDAEERLRESEEKYRALMDSAGDAVFLVNFDGALVEVNKKAEELLGYKREELIGQSFSILAAEEEREKAIQAFKNNVESGFMRISDATIKKKDGTRAPVDIVGVVVEYSGRKIMQGVFRDITELKEAEKKIHKAHAETERFLEAISSIFIGVDANDTITKWNKAAAETFDIKADEVLGKSLWSCGAHWDWSRFFEAVASCREDQDACRIDSIEYFRPDGTSGFLSLMINTIVDDNGEFSGFIVLGSDITELKQAQDNLRMAAAVYENAMEGIVVTDMNGVIQSVNPAFTRITGYSAEEAVGQTPRILKSGRHNKDFYKNMWASLRNRGQWQGEIWNKRKNGEIYPEWLTITAIKDKEGRTAYYASVFRDIMEIKRAEEELRKQRELLMQSEKLAAIGELASGVAHELNQPLNHIAIICQYLEKTLDEEEMSKEALRGEVGMINDNVQRAVDVIRSMRDFSRKDTEKASPIDVRMAIGNALKMFGSQLKSHGIKLIFRPPKEPVLAMGAMNRLSQVIINMITNARYAMDQLHEGKKKELEIKIQEGDSTIKILIKDTGAGIPKEIIPDIFTPFFTTKEPGEGTGLGLSISYQIIREFGGDIKAESEKGAGSTMKIILKKPVEADYEKK